MSNKLFDEKVTALVDMPEWEFIAVMADGFFSDTCAGCTHKGVYYSEHDIYQAYFLRNPDAEPLL
ncbi:hypothetical protein SGPC_00055 [Salmonella phage SGPC]|uniref:hypothetical protein n=1 Tax=Salmonella phage SGPC TaxID=2877945 RepID=UPI00240EBB3A|nr:hypothetical protein QA064_gp55 [Salmonella phage SGPC]UCR75481.1 hypothetical protein SGPC_00055 [Salmonella phage SGPC]